MKPVLAFMLMTAVAVCAAKSPSEEFEEKMAPHRKRDFLLPADGDAKDGQGAVRVIDIGRRRIERRWAGENEHLVEEKRRSQAQEPRNPPTHPPAPQRMHCEGSPVPSCSMR